MINTSFRLAPWADVLYACDRPWWQQYWQEIGRVFAGERWSISTSAHAKLGTRFVRGAQNSGLSRNPRELNRGRNSGHQAVGLAHLWGAARIVLIGYDMQRTGGLNHWHGNHPSPLSNLGTLGEWINDMGTLALDAKAAGLTIINASRQTALKCFERRPLRQALSEPDA